jgi:hypothetical protein
MRMAGWRNLGIGLFACALAVVPLAVGSLALPRLVDGGALAGITQVVDARLRQHTVPSAQLQAARAALSQPSQDGETLLWRAEFDGMLAGNDIGKLQAARSEATEALKADPANPRAWMLLCELGVNLKRSDAGTCFDTAFFVGPFDWYVARRRAVLAAYLWPSLDNDTKDAAARRLRLMWETDITGYKRMRAILFDVAQMPYGRVNIDRAFADDRSTLHTINLWLMLAKRPEVDPWGPP